jgi:hypothetical protein
VNFSLEIKTCESVGENKFQIFADLYLPIKLKNALEKSYKNIIFLTHAEIMDIFERFLELTCLRACCRKGTFKYAIFKSA